MNEIRNKRWGECYKRVIVIDSDSNEGVGESAVRISDGAGVQTALMLGENSVGIHGSNPLFFGDESVYIKKSSPGTLKIGGQRVILPGTITAGKIDATTVSTQVIKSVNKLSAPSASFDEINVGTANIARHTFQNLEVSVVKACSVDVVGTAKIKSLCVENGLESFMAWDE